MRNHLFTLIISIFMSSFSATSLADSKPLSAYGLTLGQSRTEVENLFKSKNIDPFYRDEFYTRYEKLIVQSNCGIMEVAFYENKLVEIACKDIAFLEEKSQINSFVNRYIGISRQIASQYGEPDLYEDYNNSTTYDSFFIREIWTIDKQYGILLSIIPGDYDGMYKFIVSYSELEGYFKLVAKLDENTAKRSRIAGLKGKSNKRSGTFYLSGSGTKLNYSVDGDDLTYVLIYIVEDGKSIEKDGGIAEVEVSGPFSDSTYLVKEPGYYYIDVKAANANSWSVSIEEEK